MQDKTQKKAAQIWLAKANEDLHWAEYNLKGKFFTQVCFIAQQAIEKGLKAYLRYRGERITGKFKTHDLVLLGKACAKFDSSFRDFMKDFTTVNQYYAPTRYPEILGLAEYSEEVAQKALTIASKIVSFVQEKV